MYIIIFRVLQGVVAQVFQMMIPLNPRLPALRLAPLSLPQSNYLHSQLSPQVRHDVFQVLYNSTISCLLMLLEENLQGT